MKTMLKKLRKMWLGGALIGLAACSEPYQKAVNVDAQPAVILASFRDAQAFNGRGTLKAGAQFNLDVAPQDVLIPVAGSASAAALGYSSNAKPSFAYLAIDGMESKPPATMTVDATATVSPGSTAGPPRPAVIYPFQAPRIEFNKLLDGDTIEKTVADKTTGRQIGKCVMQPGALTMSYAATATQTAGSEPSLQACYSPSDRLITTTAANADGSPKDYLQYSAGYDLATGASLKDKQNKTVTPYNLKFHTAPFELLLVNDKASGSRLWAAPDTGLSATCAVDKDCDPSINPSITCLQGVCNDPANRIDNTTADPQIIQLVFTGSIAPILADTQPPSSPTQDASPPTYATDTTAPLNAPLTGAKVEQINDTTGIGTPLIGTYFGVQPFSAGPPDSSDARVLFIYHPNYIASAGADPAGFAAGHYRVTLPVGANGAVDNGTVNADGSQAPLTCIDGKGGTNGGAPDCGGVKFDFYVGAAARR